MHVANILELEGAMSMDEDKVYALVYGTLSALMTAVHAVMVKGAVKIVDGSVLKLTYWTNFLSAAFLVRFTPPMSSCSPFRHSPAA